MPEHATVEQFYDKRNLLRPEQLDDRNVLNEALHSAAYAGLQSPVDGVSQLLNLPKVKMVDAPMPAEFGSTAWHAQQIGGAVGMLAPFMLVNKGVGSLMAKEGAMAETMSLRYKVTQAAAAGFVYDGLMRPVQENEGNFWAARFKHATIGAVTFGTLAGTAHGLDAIGKPMNSQLFNHTLAGITAGGVNAQLESLMAGRGFATQEESMQAGYTFAVVGLGMKGIEKTTDLVTARHQEIVRQRELRDDLREVPVIGKGGRITDVYEKIMEQPSSVLAPEQKARIMSILTDTREHYYAIDNALDATAKNKGYQIVNWKHTRGEIDQVLESAKLDKTMTPKETEDAMLASIFSDSVKTPENFIRHHLDGAARAAEILPRYFDMSKPEEAARVKGIIEAAKEHQIGPPGFMSFMAQLFIRNSIKGDMAAGAKNAFGEKMPEAEQATYNAIVDKLMKPAEHAVNDKVPLTEQEGALLDRVGVPRWKIENAMDINALQAKIAKPFENVSATNPGIVDFSKTQHEYLKLIGLDDWYVPNKATPWYNASRKIVNGDSLINYASPDGWAKIAQIRGPNTGFKDATIWDSLASAKASYNDAFTVITDDVKPLAAEGLARTEAAVERVKPAVGQWVEAHKQAYGYGADEKVSFWDKDAAPLKYAEADHPLEAQDALRFEFARLIRDKMVAELRAQQGNYSDKP
jgi:hypothetical protein